MDNLHCSSPCTRQPCKVSCRLGSNRALCPARLQHPAQRLLLARQRGSLCTVASSSDHRKLEVERAYHSLREQPTAGSEYGEGFVQYRLSGEALHLDVETLNERLAVGGALRMRHSMCPDEAFGMIFNFDGAVADTYVLQRRAWQRLAAQHGLPFPSIERQLYDMRPERAITEVLQWTGDWGRAQALAWDLAGLYAEEFGQLAEARAGVADWLAALRKCNVPCAVTTSMDRRSLEGVLERLGLQHTFSAKVTAEDGMETRAQRLLSAAIKLGRPPKQCVAFDCCPAGVTAAHNCTMKAVAVLGRHPGWRLKQADLTCASMAELTVYNVRRLFANAGAEFMDLRQAAGRQGPARAPRSWRTTNATLD